MPSEPVDRFEAMLDYRLQNGRPVSTICMPRGDAVDLLSYIRKLEIHLDVAKREIAKYKFTSPGD